MQDEVDRKIKLEQDKQKRDEEYKQKLLESDLQIEKNRSSEWFDNKYEESETESDQLSESSPEAKVKALVATRKFEKKMS